MLVAFQYDQNNFLSLTRVTFKPGFRDEWRSILEQDLHVDFVQEISFKEENIECIIRSTSATGFFPLPVFQQGSWAIIPPIAMEPGSITLTLVAEEGSLASIHGAIESLGSEITVLALSDLVKAVQGNQEFVPPFPKRQREVAAYATRHGFFENPRRITASEIAAHFGISISAVNEHLRKARRIAMTHLFG